MKGKCTGGTGTIGYKIDEDKFYHLDLLTAPLVQEAFQRYDNGDKMVEIVNSLNDKGVRNMLGGKMTHSSVNTMLKNRRYIGELSFPQWALAVWDMGTATLYMVKYDRSH